MALTRVDFQKTVANSTGVQTTASMTWQAGDLFVALVGNEDGSVALRAPPTFSGGTFASLAAEVGANSTHCGAQAFSCTVASGGSGTVTMPGGTQDAITMVWQFRGHNGTGTVSGSADAAITLSNANTGGNSWVAMGMYDFTAATNGFTGSPTVTNEVDDEQVSLHYTIWGGDWSGQSGTVSYGIASGAGTWTKVIVEVLEAGTAAAPTHPINPRLFGGGPPGRGPEVRRPFVPPDLQQQATPAAPTVLPPLGIITQARRVGDALHVRPVRGKRTDVVPVTTTAGCGGPLTMVDHGHFENNPSATIDSATFTPTGQYLIVVGSAWCVGGGGPLTMSDTFGDTGGGTWTQFLDINHNFSPDTPHVTCFYRLLGTGAVNGHATLTSHAVTADAISISLMEVSGAPTPVPVRTGQTVTSDTSLTSVTNTLPAAVCPNGLVVTGFFDVGQNTLATPDQAGYTQWANANMGGDGYRAYYKNGSADTTTTFTSPALDSASPNLGFAFELGGAQAVTAPPYPVRFYAFRRPPPALARRGRRFDVVRPQVNPPFPSSMISQARRIGDGQPLQIRPRRQTIPVPPPQATPPQPRKRILYQRRFPGLAAGGRAFVPAEQEQAQPVRQAEPRLRGGPPRRGKRTEVPVVQVVALIYPLPVVPPKVRRGMVVRGRRTDVVPPQFNPPYPWKPQTQARAPRGWLVQRSRRLEPPWTVVTPALIYPLRPTPPKIRVAMVRRGRSAVPIVQIHPPPSPSGQVVTPAWKERYFAPRRGRVLPMVAAQDGPIPPIHPVRKPNLPRRGRVWNYIQAQVIIPRAPDWIMRPHRARGWRLVRGKRIEFPTPQAVAPIPQLPLPTTQKRAQRGWLFRRGKRSDVVPPQIIVTPQLPLPVPSPKARRAWLRPGRRTFVVVDEDRTPQFQQAEPRVRGALLRRGRRTDVPLGQDQPIPAMVNKPRRGLLARSRSAPWQRPVPAQVIIPRAPDWIMRPHRQRGWLLRRGKRIEFPTPQATAPIPQIPLPVLQKRAQRGWLFRRGRRADVVPPQIIVTPGYQPQIVTPAWKERYALLRRRGIQQHVPGQPHPIVPTRVVTRRVPSLVRRRGQQQHVGGQHHPIIPTRVVPRRVPLGLLRKRGQGQHVPGQPHPIVPQILQKRRPAAALFRRQSAKWPPPTILPQPNRWKPDITSQYRALRGWLSRYGRGRSSEFIHPQVFTYLAPERADVQERTMAAFTEPARVVLGERDRAGHREPDRIDSQERTETEEP